MGCLNNEYSLLWVTRAAESKAKKKKRKKSWSSAQSLGIDCAGQKSRGRNSGNENRRAKGGERR